MSDDAELQQPAESEAEDSRPDMEPLQSSRFLFVDVAAQRAKQLRRGARPRVQRATAGPHKLERIAMDEVRSGLIHYSLPVTNGPGRGEQA